MKLFRKYLKQRWKLIATGIVFCVIFVVSFALYHLPVEAVIYPALLCAGLGGVIVIIDYTGIKRKHDILERINSVTDAVLGVMPQANNLEDEDYQLVIGRLCEEYNEYRTDTLQRYSDMMDYYTVWAHQIKTPIASMKLNLQNEDSALSRVVSSDLFRIEQYVEMVLTFLRLGSDSTDYVIKEYDLDSIIKQVAKKFAGEFIGRRIRLVYEPLNVKVLTDEKWLSFVIEQVISNALKYTKTGSITITLQQDMKLCIADTGIGIAKEDLPRIFEKGYTGYNGRMDKKASGIGLYLCKRVCSNLGHDIKAESVVDEGTVITIDLSRAKLEVE